MTERPGFRPRLNPALRRLWRDTRTLQLGHDPDRALVVDGVDAAVVRLLGSLDGTRTDAEIVADAASGGIDPLMAGDVLAGLRRGDALLDGPTVASLDQLAPDRAAAALLGAPAPNLRADATVVIYDAGRVGAPLAAVLAAAGVGAVSVVDDGTVDLTTCAPGGTGVADLHRSRRAAAHDALRRVAPDVDTATPPPERSPDLVVFTAGRPIDPDLRAALHHGRVPHLVAGLRETTAIVGPLVVPGRASCLRCADLHRSERDPDWPLIATQLSVADRHHVPPCDVALAVTTAGLAALQALAFLDGGAPATVDGTLELAHPDWRIRRRSWPPHPDCDCRAAAEVLPAS